MPGLDSLIFFFLAGLLLKVADHWGESSPRAITGYIAAFASAASFWALISADTSFSTVMIAIAVGNVFAKKVDQPNLIVGLVFLIGLSVAFGYQLPIIAFLVPFALTAYLDEFLQTRTWPRQLSALIRHRPVLKAVVLVAVAFGFNPLAALGLLVFDAAYEIANVTTRSLAKRKQFTQLA